MFVLVVKKVMTRKCSKFFYFIPVLLVSLWYIHVTDLFFRHSNNCREVSKSLWLAHILLLIEAFPIFCLESCLC